MMERLDVPRAPIARLLKGALPESYKISREVKEACARAAGLYLLYMANAADECCRASGRTTVSAEDVLGGLEESELEALCQPTHDFVRAYRKKMRKEGGAVVEPIKPTRSDGGGKKSHSKKKRSSSSSSSTGGGSSSRSHKKGSSSSGGSDRKRVRTDVDLTADKADQRREGGSEGDHGEQH
jgi:histone H3/H4